MSMRRRSKAAVLLAAGGILLAGPLYAEDQTTQEMQAPAAAGEQPFPQRKDQSPEEVQKMMETVMGPMMGHMMSQMIKSMAKTMAEPEVAEYLATFTRSYYLALVNRGFTEEEALRIVAAVGIPSLGGKQ